MRSGAKLAVLAVVAGAASFAIAQSAKRLAMIPHEDLPPPNGDHATPMIGSSSSSSGPAAITAGDKLLPKPSSSTTKSHTDEPVLGTRDFGADRKTTMAPDSATDPDSLLHYVSVFNPDVLPFKRMSALDAVNDDYTLKIGHAALIDVPVGGTTDKARDRFWGSVLVQLSPGTDVPLPSVAPDMRILSYEIKPKTTLKFSKDGADNFYVRSDESSASGTYRLVFLVDADAGYFAPSLPTKLRYRTRDVARMAPPELLTTLPDRVRRSAQVTLDKLGVDPDMELGVVFNKLVEKFRRFEGKKLPPSTGDIYRDLCDSEAGVCRHRSFAFMITANAIGIPTRLVQNEAHVFVEVWFPERRWQRIDLGGAALKMEVSGADNKTLHRPRADDPFAKPSQYANNYTQLEGDIQGLTKQQIDDKHKPLDQSPASGSFDPAGAGSGSAGAPDRITPDPTLPTVTQDPKKATPHLEVTTADASAYRGDIVHVEGHVSASGRALADHPVDVFLAPAGQNGAHPIPLGRTVTDAAGHFTQDFTLPGTLDLKTYEIFLASPEDVTYNAALSN